MTEEIRDYPRSHYEAVLDVKYCARLHYLHVALYRRLRMLFSFLSLVFGSAALAAALKSLPPWVVTASGVAVAALSALGVVAGFVEKTFQHQDLYKRYAQLAASSGGMPLEELDRQLALIDVDSIGEIGALQYRAYNDNLLSNGRSDYVVPLSMLSRLLSILV